MLEKRGRRMSVDRYERGERGELGACGWDGDDHDGVWLLMSWG